VRGLSVALALQKRGVKVRVVTNSRHVAGFGGLWTRTNPGENFSAEKSSPGPLFQRLPRGGHALRRAGDSVERASPFALALFQMGVPIDYIPSESWPAAMEGYVQGTKPRLVVLDTFPWGLRGEWKRVNSGGISFVTIARRLNVGEYLNAARVPWDPKSRQIEQVIVSEPLNQDYEELLASSQSEVFRLHGRILFPAEDLTSLVQDGSNKVGYPSPMRLLRFARNDKSRHVVARSGATKQSLSRRISHRISSARYSVPEHLQALLERDRVWLVVHSGPEHEINALVEAAREDMKAFEGGTLLVAAPDGNGAAKAISGRDNSGREFIRAEYFPASLLYKSAFRIITAAGYNSVAEAWSWRHKWICIPFPRRYDDQEGRLGQEFGSSRDAAETVAEILVRRLGQV